MYDILLSYLQFSMSAGILLGFVIGSDPRTTYKNDNISNRIINTVVWTITLTITMPFLIPLTLYHRIKDCIL